MRAVVVVMRLRFTTGGWRTSPGTVRVCVWKSYTTAAVAISLTVFISYYIHWTAEWTVANSDS